MKVLITRAPDRTASLVRLLSRAGHEPLLAPLREPRALTRPEHDAALRALVTARPEAVVLTSVNGVRGLRALLAGEAAELVKRARVLAVGPATHAAAREAGLHPEDWNLEGRHRASAAGLLDGWPEDLSRPGTRVLAVHGKPHRPELIEGLRARGLRVKEAVVYVMVDHPAEDPLPRQGAAPAPAAPVLDPAQAGRLLREAGGGVVVATSPELLRALARCGPLPREIVCIGRTTAEAARELGHVPVTSADTSPEALAEAVQNLSETM